MRFAYFPWNNFVDPNYLILYNLKAAHLWMETFPFTKNPILSHVNQSDVQSKEIETWKYIICWKEKVKYGPH